MSRPYCVNPQPPLPSNWWRKKRNVKPTYALNKTLSNTWPRLPQSRLHQEPKCPITLQWSNTFLGTLQLPMAIYMLDYYLPMLSPNDGYNETGLTMQSAGRFERHGNLSSFPTYSKEVNLAIGKSLEDTMRSPSDTRVLPKQKCANCLTVKPTTTKSALLGQADSLPWSGSPMQTIKLGECFRSYSA